MRSNNPEEDDEDSEEESSDESSSDESDTQSTVTTAVTAKSASIASTASTKAPTVDTATKKKKKVSMYSTVRKAQRFSLANLLKSRKIVAVETIQRYVRGFLWRRAEERRMAREARIAKERNIRHVRRRQMERDYWWDADVDTDDLHRYQIEDLLMRLGLATWGTREQLLVRFKRWILHRAIIADIGMQCAAVAVGRTLNGSGGVYSIDIPTPSRRVPPLVQLRQFQGKGYQKLCASFASDSVYSIDGKGNVYLLRGSDHVQDVEKPVLAMAKKAVVVGGASGSSGEELSTDVDSFGTSGGWHLAGRWLSIMKAEDIQQVVPGAHFTLAAAQGGDAFSWGLNAHGELGNSKPLSMATAEGPTAITHLPPNEEVSRVSAGTYHGAAVMASGRVFAWGCNSSNELAQKNTFTSDLRDCFYSVPVLVELTTPNSTIPTTAQSGFGLSSRPKPSMGGRRHVVLISCGANHTACVDSHGRVITWGCYDGGRLGRKDLGWPTETHPDDLAEEQARAATRRKVRPQTGAPPGEVDGLHDGSANNGQPMCCIDIACGAWHTLMLLVPKDGGARGGGTAGGGAGADNQSPPVSRPGTTKSTKPPNSSSKKTRSKKSKEKVHLGIGEGKRCGEVWAFGSGVSGQLGVGNTHIATTASKVLGLPQNIRSIRAGTYVSAAACEDGQIWYWGSRGAGMFQPIPRQAELPSGQRAGGLQDFACTRDGLTFLTVGVAAEYFEQMVDMKVAAFREQRKADQALFHEKVMARLEEKRRHDMEKGEAFLRGAMCRFRFARRMVKFYISRKMKDPETGRKRRYYINTKTGVVLRKLPYFLKAFGMEPDKEEEVWAARLLQSVIRGRQANQEARRRAAELYELCEDPDNPDMPFWFNPKTKESSWEKPRWLR